MDDFRRMRMETAEKRIKENAKKSDVRQPRYDSAPNRDVRLSARHRNTSNGSGNGLSSPMHERGSRRQSTQTHRPPKGIRASLSPTSSPTKGNSGPQRRNALPSTTTDPRGHHRTSSHMEHTIASKGKAVIHNYAGSREGTSNSTATMPQQLRPTGVGGKTKRAANNEQTNVAAPVRYSNGIANRKKPQKLIIRTKAIEDIPTQYRKLNTQSSDPNRDAMEFEIAMRSYVHHEQQEPQNREHCSSSSASELEEEHSMRSNHEQHEIQSQQHFSSSSTSKPEEELSTSSQRDRWGQQIPSEVCSSSNGTARGDVFQLVEGFVPEIPERKSSNPKKSGKSWAFSIPSPWGSTSQPNNNLEALFAENFRLNKQASHLRHENTKLTASLQDLKQTNDQYESELRMLQTKSFKEIAKTVWSPLEDQVVREILESCHKEIEDWAEENCVESFEDIDKSCTSKAEAQELLVFCKDFASTDSDNIWTQFQIWNKREADPDLILTAAMTFYMYDRVFRNPFLVLDAFEEQVQQDESQIGEKDELEDEKDHEDDCQADDSSTDQEECKSEGKLGDDDERSSHSKTERVIYQRVGDEDSQEESGEDSQEESREDSQEGEGDSDSDEATAASIHFEAREEFSSPHKASSNMLETYRTLMNLNVEQSQQWRAQLLKILLPTPSPGTRFDGLKPADPRINEYLRSYCTHHVDQFSQSPARILLRHERTEENRQNLIDCWVRTIHLFTQLQTQLRLVKWTAPDQCLLVGKVFDSTYMDGHTTQAFSRKDRVPVSLVLSPAIALFGNEDGQNYDAERIVVKAVVCVGDVEEEL